MTTDIVSSKSDAKKDIQGAIFGLVVILGAVLILYIINPDIGTVDLSFDTPPRAAAPTGATLLLPEIQDCQANPGECNFETIPCGVKRTMSSNYKGPPPERTYDCSLKRAACFGDFLVAPGGEEAACLTTQEAAAAKITEVAAAYCPSGETCTADICINGRQFDCEEACFDDGGTAFDKQTNICVTSPSGETALIENRIETLLNNAGLAGRIVNNNTTAAGFASSVGAVQTYYLAELAQGPGNAAANNSAISAMREVCSEASNTQEADGQTLTIEVDEYDDKYYVGCIQS